MSLERHALRALVRQFARPLDCLRELVQNSLDAGASRVDVTVDAADAGADESLVRLIVDDRGSGMDGKGIDDFLTTLFASSKAGDLTRIGRYGVGFVSVFALDPEQVIVQTGRAGESWIVRFDASWTYEKVRAEQPHVGTRVTVFLRRPTSTVPAFAADVRAALEHWCEHAPRPIWLTDGTASAPPPDPEREPFGAFHLDRPPSLISRPLDLPGCAVVLRVEQPDLVALIGAGGLPTCTLLRHGLTLDRGETASLVGDAAERLGHLSLKIDGARLEHRLGRDGVVQDEAWFATLDVVRRAAEQLGEALLDRAAVDVAASVSAEPLYRMISEEIAANTPRRADALAAAARARPIWPTREGPTSLEALVEQERRLGGVLVADDAPRLEAALDGRGFSALMLGRDGISLLRALPGPAGSSGRWHGAPRCRPVRATRAFVHLLPPTSPILPAEVRALRAAGRLLARALGEPRALRLVEVSDETPFAGLLAPRPPSAPIVVGPVADGETLVIRAHPLVRAAAALVEIDEELAGLGLAHGILASDPAAPPGALASLTR